MELCIPDVVARGSTHHGKGNGRAWIIHRMLEEFRHKRYVRPHFSAVRMSVRKTFSRLHVARYVVDHFPQGFPGFQPLYIFTIYRVVQIRDRENIREPAVTFLSWRHAWTFALKLTVRTVFRNLHYFCLLANLSRYLNHKNTTILNTSRNQIEMKNDIRERIIH